MRALPLAAAVLTAALTLTACSSDDSGDTKDKAATSSAKGDTACAIGAMTVRVGPANAAPAAGDTGNVPVTITNGSGAKCTLDGLPSVTLGTVAVEPDPSAKATRTTLAKGAETSFTLTYVMGEAGGDSLAVTEGRFSLPGSSDTHDFTWSYGDVAVRSDGKTPDASVSGFQTSGD
ncbi:DUF4232 domain-containing protein [Streptomyces sp. S3(2020)]|uniref:DUF4232 domain-containing protein n=1 Tax=Streptomyces sp. S3(2020) TaxID=2732044 RepID=UPI0014884875|nr:DUF4232 domain-containing protein [Streptomyces sp. S3(2020)]NNN32250.1 DUF4232 domain-containing protein [Streptomyces sp. S3(2020)]